MRTRTAFLFALLTGLVTLASPAGAQCTIQSVPDQITTRAMYVTPTFAVGQSFTACQSGIVAYVLFREMGIPVKTLNFGMQHGTDLCAPEYTSSVKVTLDASRLRVFTNFRVVQGEVYSFSIAPAGGR